MLKKLMPVLLGLACAAGAVSVPAAECEGTSYQMCEANPNTYCCDEPMVIVTILGQEFCATLDGSPGAFEFKMPAGPGSPLDAFHEYCESQFYKEFQQDVKDGEIPSGVEHAIEKVEFKGGAYACAAASVKSDTLMLESCSKSAESAE